MTTTEKLYTLKDFRNSELPELKELTESLEDWEKEVAEAIIELKLCGEWREKDYFYSLNEIKEAIESIDRYVWYSSIIEYHNCCDETIDFSGNSMLESYFDYDAFHRDCDFDVEEASNGIVLYCY